MQPVRPDEREEDGEEAAAVWPVTLGDETREVAEFQADEDEAEHERDRGVEDDARLAAHLHRDGREAEGEHARHDRKRLPEAVYRPDDLVGARSAGRAVNLVEHAIGREQARENERVAHHVEPEPQRTRGDVVMLRRLVLPQHAVAGRGPLMLRHQWTSASTSGGRDGCSAMMPEAVVRRSMAASSAGFRM